MTHPSHQTVNLARGRHQSPDDGACVMELASMLADEPFTDAPATASPIVGAFLRTYNDSVDDGRRQDLYAYAADVVGTRGPKEAERRRSWLCLEQIEAMTGKCGPMSRATNRLLNLLRREAAAEYAARLFARESQDPRRHAEALAFVQRLIAAGRRDELSAGPIAVEASADAAPLA